MSWFFFGDFRQSFVIKVQGLPCKLVISATHFYYDFAWFNFHGMVQERQTPGEDNAIMLLETLPVLFMPEINKWACLRQSAELRQFNMAVVACRVI